MEISQRAEQLYSRHPRATIAALVILFLGLAAIFETRNNEDSPRETEDLTSLDTFIPTGFVLVPISVQNLTTLDSMIGPYAMVDLYAEGETTATGRGLRLIRSPRDPSQFAVLVPDAAAKQIVQKSSHPFQVIVKNPEQKTKSFEARTHSIHWED